MNRNKLSIIIPHYNSSKLLKKLLSTIPQGKNIQIIVVDDKSKKEDIEYIKTLYSKYDFELYINDTDKKGAGVARNIALQKAKGKWILFADSDDYFTDNFYEAVDEYFDSDKEIVFFKPTSIYIDTNEITHRHVNFKKMLDNYNNGENSSELFLRYNIPNPICKMIKKDFILNYNIKFDEVIASNDVLFSTKVGLYMKKFDICDEIIYVITRNRGSLTTKMSENIFDTRLKVKINYHNFLKEKLTQNEMDILNIYFVGWLYSSLRYGISHFIKTYFLIKKEQVILFDKNIYSPSFIVKKLIHRYKIYKNNKRYYIEN
ncbi:MAG: glycosyltransferase family 2 protein [Campylobacterota bacterium]|nr:glycosyltransferase family 2 protein [Campylobacterota bacterium]